MKREKTGDRRRGAALLVVLCLAAMLFAVGAAMLFASSSALAAVTGRQAARQAERSVKDLCEILIQEMENTGQNSLGLQLASMDYPEGTELELMASSKDAGFDGSFSGTVTFQAGGALLEVEAEFRGKTRPMALWFVKTEEGWLFSEYRQKRTE